MSLILAHIVILAAFSFLLLVLFVLAYNGPVDVDVSEFSQGVLRLILAMIFDWVVISSGIALSKHYAVKFTQSLSK